jgi:hypothetical protein
MMRVDTAVVVTRVGRDELVLRGVTGEGGPWRSRPVVPAVAAGSSSISAVTRWIGKELS